MLSEQVIVFETFDTVGLRHAYAEWAQLHTGLILRRQSHVYTDADGRRWFVLIVFYLAEDGTNA
jgi:hypothetical protein